MRFPQQYHDQDLRRELLMASTLVKGVGVSQEQAYDAEKEPELVAKLDFEHWLPFAAKTYHISPHIEDYIFKNVPICPSDFPNRNGIGFPLQELIKFQPPPMNRQVFEAWRGCPMHLEHDNEDCTKAYGVVFDTALTRIQNFGQGRHYKVMGLAGIDKNKHPDIAQEVLDGKINTVSMGALADSFSCSVCGREVGDNQFANCSHVGGTKDVNWQIVDYMGRQHIAFLRAHGLSPIELSLVRDPAWVPALSDHVMTW